MTKIRQRLFTVSSKVRMDGKKDTALIVDLRRGWAIIWETLADNRVLYPLLAVLSILYGFGVFFREKAYSAGIFSTKKLPCPVISVGNLTVGGTGKTPVVEMVAGTLLNKGFHPVVLSRGYKRRSKGSGVTVFDGDRFLAQPKDAGDEPYMLARRLGCVPVLVGINRYYSGMIARKIFKVDCFVLDDGFQHLGLSRDMDILVINARDPFGKGKLLPWGGLREPLYTLARASLILINKTGTDQDISPIRKKIRIYNKDAPILETFYVPEYIAAVSDYKSLMPLSSLKGKSVVVFSGIAEPRAFFEQLEGLGAVIKKGVIFEDHHWFSEKEMDRIKGLSKDLSAEFIITTEKDAVRLPPKDAEGIYFLKMKMGIKGDEKIWEDTILSILVR